MEASTEQIERLERLQNRRSSDDVDDAPRRRSTAWWMRWAHVYLSMISLFVVLFFGLTGITLNHQDWTFGTEPVSTTTTGAVPSSLLSGDAPDFLGISEFLRSDYDVRGEVTDYRDDGNEGTIAYAGPGYRAQMTFGLADGNFELIEQDQGWITVLNDLHKGRDTKSSWRWLVDISGVLLVIVGLTGLVIQLYMRKRRTRAIVSAIVGTAVTLLLLWIAIT